MATKKQLINRWHDEPGRTIAVRILQMLVDYGELTRPLYDRAFQETGNYRVPMDWFPPFDTQSVFALLDGLPFRDEVGNGRDLRGIPSIASHETWDFSDTDFSFISGGCFSGKLDRAIFDGSKGPGFEFRMRLLQNTRFRRTRLHWSHSLGVHFWGDCLQCDFSEAVMKKAVFAADANLQGSTFAAANLDSASFFKCDLRGCDFRGANLSNAAIQEAIIDKTTDFRGANLKDLAWQDRYDKYGNLFRHGSDWRQGTFDSTTIHD